MLISAKTTWPISIFFSPKEAQLLFRQLQKLSARNIAALKWESRKTKCWVPWNSPYAVSVKVLLESFVNQDKLGIYATMQTDCLRFDVMPRNLIQKTQSDLKLEIA